jgi:prolyl 4-hydroxylase
VNTINDAIYVEPDNRELFDIRENLMSFTPGRFETEKEYTEEFDTALTRTTCNGRIRRSAKELSKLHCRFMFRKGYSMIAPFKIEEVHLDPNIFIFHEVIHDKEISRLKELSRPILDQSVVTDDRGNTEVSLDIRVSKVAWFSDHKEKLIKTISERIGMMTGLLVNSESSEKLQIQQYGIGGFYMSHHDGFEQDDEISQNGGNRIATALIYVSTFHDETKFKN